MSINCGGNLNISNNSNNGYLNINGFSNIIGIQFGKSTGNYYVNEVVTFDSPFLSEQNYAVFMTPSYSQDNTYSQQVGIVNSPSVVTVTNTSFTWCPSYVYSYTGNGNTYTTVGAYTINWLAICYTG
jgi:hypothetical protein